MIEKHDRETYQKKFFLNSSKAILFSKLFLSCPSISGYLISFIFLDFYFFLIPEKKPKVSSAQFSELLQFALLVFVVF